MPAQNTDDYFFSLPLVIFLQVSDHPTSLSYKYLKLLACGEGDLRIALWSPCLAASGRNKMQASASQHLASCEAGK